MTCTAMALLLDLGRPPRLRARMHRPIEFENPPWRDPTWRMRYVLHGTYGFSINPPKDWQMIRQRVPERRGVTSSK